LDLIGPLDEEQSFPRAQASVPSSGFLGEDSDVKQRAVDRARETMAAARKLNAESKELRLDATRETDRAAERSRQATELQSGLLASALQQLDRGRLETEADQMLRNLREQKIQRLEALETALRGVIVGGNASAARIVKDAFQELGRGDVDERPDVSELTGST